MSHAFETPQFYYLNSILWKVEFIKRLGTSQLFHFPCHFLFCLEQLFSLAHYSHTPSVCFPL